MEDAQKTELFESMPIPRAVMKLAVPTVLSSLVMVLYNLADTYFVGMLNNAVRKRRGHLGGPGAAGLQRGEQPVWRGQLQHDEPRPGHARTTKPCTAARPLAFTAPSSRGCCFPLLYTVFQVPLLAPAGRHGRDHSAATVGYMPVDGHLWRGAGHPQRGHGLPGAGGGRRHARQHRHHERLLPQHRCLDPIFILPWGLNMGAEGAGLATFLSNCVACLYFFVLLYVKRGRTYVCVNPKMFSL